MSKKNGITTITVAAFVLVILFALLGLPYNKFSWVEAIAYYGNGNPPADSENPSSDPGIPPIGDVDPADNPPTFTTSAPTLIQIDGETPAQPITVFAPEVSVAEVGNAAVIARGIIVAVDYFALTPDGLSPTGRFVVPPLVCLRGEGVLVFMAADQSPRVPVDLEMVPSPVPGYTCAYLERPGMVVLVEH